MIKKQIIVYLCQTKPKGIIAPPIGSSGVDGITYTNNKYRASINPTIKFKHTITVYLHKISNTENDCLDHDRTKIIYVGMIKENSILIKCLWGNNNFIRWCRPIELDELTGSFIRRKTFLEIEYTNPDFNCGMCFWKSTTIYAHYPTKIFPRYPFIFKSFANYTTEGEIFIEDSIDTDLTWIYTPKDEYIHNENQPAIVPGGKIDVFWNMLFNQISEDYLVQSIFYNTPMLTGGIIKNVINNGTIDQQYEIEIEGGTYFCRPTDFARYEIGSYVYILRYGKQEANIVNRQIEYSRSIGTKNHSKEIFASIPEQINNTATSFMLARVNTLRASVGVNPLIEGDFALTTAADNHIKYLGINGYFTTPDNQGHGEVSDLEGFTGTTPDERIRDYAGYTGFATGENVATNYANDKSVFEGWKNSPGHYANMINDVFTEMSYVKIQGESENKWYYCQCFGAKRDNTFGGSNSGWIDNTEEQDYNNFRVVPLTMGEGLITGSFETFETKDYDHSTQFEKVFEMAYHTGTIITIEESTVTVEITITNGDGSEKTQTFSGVEVFYHCPDSNTVTDGINAFAINDSVIVLNEGGNFPSNSDLCVIGFSFKMKYCSLNHVISVFTDDEETAVAWDITTDQKIQIQGDNTLSNVLSQIKSIDKSYENRPFIYASPSERRELTWENDGNNTKDSGGFLISWYPGQHLPAIHDRAVTTNPEPHGFADTNDFNTYPNFLNNGLIPHYTHGSGEFYGEHGTVLYQVWEANKEEEAVNNSTPDSYEYKKAAYLCTIGKAGSQEQFTEDINHNLTNNQGNPLTAQAPYPWYNPDPEDMRDIGYIEYTRLYFHGLFYPEKENMLLNYNNCEKWYDFLFDTWSNDITYQAIPDGYAYSVQSDWETKWDPQTIIYLGWYNAPSRTGPNPDLAATWVKSGIYEGLEQTILYNYVILAINVEYAEEGHLTLPEGKVKKAETITIPKLDIFIKQKSSRGTFFTNDITDDFYDRMFYYDRDWTYNQLLSDCCYEVTNELAYGSYINGETNPIDNLRAAIINKGYFLGTLRTEDSVELMPDPESITGYPDIKHDVTMYVIQVYADMKEYEYEYTASDIHNMTEIELLILIENQQLNIVIEDYEEKPLIDLQDAVIDLIVNDSPRINLYLTPEEPVSVLSNNGITTVSKLTVDMISDEIISRFTDIPDECNDIGIATQIMDDAHQWTIITIMFGYMEHRWPGYYPVPCNNLRKYIEENFKDIHGDSLLAKQEFKIGMFDPPQE